MAEKRTIDINIKNNAGEAEKDFKSFNKAMDETTKSAKNLDATFEEVYGDLQPLTTRMGEAEDRLYELALAGDTASKEYQELLEKVGNYRKVQIQTDLAVDGAATTMGQKLGSALTGATSGFAATQGAMAVFGSESEKLEQTLVKVQGALAIQQGVQGLATAYRELGGKVGLLTKAQAAFNFVMNLNPIFLIATAVAAGIAALAKFTNFLDPVINKLKEFTDFIGITEKKTGGLAAATKALKKEALSQINAQKSAVRSLSNARQKAYDKEITLLRAAGKETRDIERQKLKETINRINQQMALEEKAAKHRTGLAGAVQIVNKELYKNSLDEAKFALEVFDTETQKIDADNLKTKQANYKQYAQERKAQARLIQDIEISLMEEGKEKELEINRVKFERLIADIKGTNKEKKRLRELYEKQEQQAVSKIREKFRKEEAAKELQFLKDNRLPFLKAQADEEVEVEITKWSLIGQAQQAAFEKERMLRKANQEFALQTASDTLNVISDITNLFADKNEKAAKKAFQIQKAVSIAQATIDTYKSANAIFASTAANPISIANPSAPFIAAGVAVAAGLVNVATIASQKFQGGAGGGGGTQASAPNLEGGEVAPQFNVVGDTGVNQLAQIQQQPTQAFVVSGEVTSAQALDRNRVQNATL